MNENSTLRYLGEAYRGVRNHLDSLWIFLGSDAAMQIGAVMAAFLFTTYAVAVLVGTTRDFMAALGNAFRRN
ncbi:MAG: hypothetical protein WCY02_08215 [Parvibaculum sp.]